MEDWIKTVKLEDDIFPFNGSEMLINGQAYAWRIFVIGGHMCLHPLQVLMAPPPCPKASEHQLIHFPLLLPLLHAVVNVNHIPYHKTVARAFLFFQS